MQNTETDFEKADYDVYKTLDYTIFSFMEDNRIINADIVRKIKGKIQEFGWIKEPILVNEKLQIIDGQHRFTALKELGFPIEFIIDEGIGVKECRAINEDRRNWSTMDYVISYSKSGEEEQRQSYTYLKTLCDKYDMLSVGTIYSISKNQFATGGGGCAKTIKSGELKLDKKKFDETEKVLSYVSKFTAIATEIGGSYSTFYCCIGFICKNKLCNQKRLYEMLEQYKNRIPPVATVKETLKEISEVYNYRLRQDKVHFDIELEKMIDEQNLSGFDRRKINKSKALNKETEVQP